MIKRKWRWLAQIAILWCLGEGIAAAQVSITQPANDATVSGSTQICASWNDPPVQWIDFYVDGNYLNSSPQNCITWNTSGLSGQHQISVSGFNGNFLGSASITVTVANNGNQGGNTISALTGSASGISGADTNPADYGNYPVWGDNYALIGGPLLNDTQAASFVKATQQSTVETSSQWGSANQQDNNYFNSVASNNPQDYLNQLSAFQSAYNGNPWQPAINRVDGACAMANPTTAEVLQWAANKWGVNPILFYAVVTEESSWNQAGVGDNGRSSGLFQIADRGDNHAFPGFSGYGQNLARENSCFNADFWGAWIWGSYHGMIGSPGGDIGAAIQSWYSGYATSAGDYTNGVYGMLSNQQWVSWWFDGVKVPY